VKNSFLMGAVIVLLSACPVSANVQMPYAAAPTLPKSVGGMVAGTGHVIWGNFTVQRLAKGEYAIDFARNYFKHCAAMVVGGLSGSTIVGTVTENVCLPQPHFSVDLYDATTHKPIDADFQFVATEVE
jgi:hypothetical protein